MRFMAMHRSSASDEAGTPPSQEFMGSMGMLIQEGMRAGVFIAGEGLQASRNRVRLHFRNGEHTLSRGPFEGSTDLLAGFALIKARSMDDATLWGVRLGKALARDTEIEIGPVCEPWDLGMCPPPEGNPPIRYGVLYKGDPDAEAGRPTPPPVLASLAALRQEMTEAGVLLSMEALEPTRKSTRLRFKAGERTIIDGPFAEAKEVIAGFALLRFDTLPDMIEWTGKFGRLFPEVLVDIRPLQEQGNLA
ncbi:MAG: hypothetical protein KBH14_08895 [Vicinamibacteria bacterium]|nr:hypothetical protein [Vicinamibacteria bacterium]